MRLQSFVTTFIVILLGMTLGAGRSPGATNTAQTSSIKGELSERRFTYANGMVHLDRLPHAEPGLVYSDGFLVADRSSREALYRLETGLRILADPTIIDDPKFSERFLPLFPMSRLRPYVDANALLAGSRFVSEVWKGENFYEKDESRTAFIRDVRNDLLALRPTLPIRVMWTARYSLPKNVQPLAPWPLLDWHNEPIGWGKLGQDPMADELSLPQPTGYPRSFEVMPQHGRELYELSRQEVVRWQTETKAGKEHGDGTPIPEWYDGRYSPFQVVFRYAITDAAVRGGRPVFETAAVDLSIRLTRDLQTVVQRLSLPSNAILFEAPPRQGPESSWGLDAEWARLLMIKREPKLAAPNNSFLGETFRVRREIEAHWFETSCENRSCPPPPGGLLMGALLLENKNSPAAAQDMKQFSEIELVRAGKIDNRIRVRPKCDPCGKRDAEQFTIEPDEFFESAKEEALSLAQALVPDAVGVRRLPSGRDIEAFVALVPNPNWEGVAVPIVGRGIEFEFGVTASTFVRDDRQKTTFVVALEPVAVSYIEGETRKTIVLTGSPIEDARRDVPKARADVLGVRLGMPIDDAIAALRQQFNGAKTTESTTRPFANGSLSSISPCQFIEIRQGDAGPRKIAALEAAARQAGKTLSDEDRRRVQDQADAELEDALDKQRCPDSPLAPVVFAYSLVVDHGEDMRENIQLFRTGRRLGPGAVSLIYRSVSDKLLPAFKDGLAEKYGPPSAVQGDNTYWIETPAYLSAFKRSKGRCLTFWQSGSVPDIIPKKPCGSFVRANKNDMILTDTSFISNEAAMVASKRSVEERQKPPPNIKF